MCGDGSGVRQTQKSRAPFSGSAAGYSTPEEFVEHVLERELAKLEDAGSDEEIVKKLQGLGYID